jgi:hypothetical protein
MQEEFVQNFPSFEFSYDIHTHKNVPDANVVFAIPEGDKCLVWFTKNEFQHCCLLLALTKEKRIESINKIPDVRFDVSLTNGYGTIVEGILFHLNGVRYFCLEDIYFYAGQSLVEKNYITKLQKIKDLLDKGIYQKSFSGDFIIFGLPIMSNTLTNLLKHCPPYAVDMIKFRFWKSKKICSLKYQVKRKQCVMKICPDIDHDIYHVYSLENNQYCDIAAIPNYQTSLMMNQLFRKIKHFDKFEESDDEEDFQDCREDKYVMLDKSYEMVCVFNPKFKKWQPISVVS